MMNNSGSTPTSPIFGGVSVGIRLPSLLHNNFLIYNGLGGISQNAN